MVRMTGLREQKKAQTRADLQRHALRLFSTQGYTATSVDQIAAAAGVSRATFFRYFPAKEDVVLYDDVDPVMAETFARQPKGTPLLTAMRTTLRDTFALLTLEKREQEEVRMRLGRTVPELRAALRESQQFTIAEIAKAVGTATGRAERDLDVLLFAATISGARLAAQQLADSTPGLSYIDALDQALSRLEGGVPLAAEPIRLATDTRAP
jgi:AcrR family transcriptional regulator